MEFELTGDGTKQWNDMAQGRPTTASPSTSTASSNRRRAFDDPFEGRGVITGTFGEREAKDLALVLRFGALPVQLDRQTVQKVSATLGPDSLRAGLIAGLIGLGLVLLYMMLYYRALGIVVVLRPGRPALMYAIVTLLCRPAVSR